MGEITVLRRSWESLCISEPVRLMGLCQELPSSFGSVRQTSTCSACMGMSDLSPKMRGVLEILPHSLHGSMFEELCEECLQGKADELVASILIADVPARLFESFSTLDFEGRKTFANLFAAMLQVDASDLAPGKFSKYLQAHPQFLSQLLEGLGSYEISLHCGAMLRSCTCDPQLTACLLQQGAINRCVDLAQHNKFDISCEAFALLRDLFEHSAIVAKHLDSDMEVFFDRYKALLESKEYTIQRQALKLLGCLLLNSDFMDAMATYIQDFRFLKIHMNLLRSSSVRIQHDNFHIFKLFVANPYRPRNITQTLFKNKMGLLQLLENYQDNIEGDDLFLQDLTSVMQMLDRVGEHLA